MLSFAKKQIVRWDTPHHAAFILPKQYGRYGYGFAADEAEAIPFLKVLFTEDLQTSVQRFGTLVCNIQGQAFHVDAVSSDPIDLFTIS